MNTAEWILVAILSVSLFIFIVVGIIFLVKLMGLVKEAKKIVVKGQDIAENANQVVSNVRGMTSIGGVVKTFAEKYTDPKYKTSKEKRDGKKSNNLLIESRNSTRRKDRSPLMVCLFQWVKAVLV